MGYSCAYRTVVGKPERMRPHIRPKSRWWDDIKLDIRKVEWVSVDCTDLAVDTEGWLALVNALTFSHRASSI